MSEWVGAEIRRVQSVEMSCVNVGDKTYNQEE